MARSLKRRLVNNHVLKWVNLERIYADTKYPVSTIEQFGGTLRDEDCDFVMQYLKRAQLFGLETPRGRQQLSKALSTIFDFTRASVYLYGSLPKPGISSTDEVPELWEPDLFPQQES